MGSPVTDGRAEQLARAVYDREVGRTLTDEQWERVRNFGVIDNVEEAGKHLAAIDADPAAYGYRKIEHGFQDFPFSVTYDPPSAMSDCGGGS